MNFVENLNEIKVNLKTLENYLNFPNQAAYNYAVKRIELGTCFISYRVDGEYKFAPSRFIGYQNNSNSAHENNPSKDGRDTNSVISNIIGKEPSINLVLEQEYKKYCISLGFQPRKAGNFGVERKYWEIDINTE
jgi:hypothetical protein